VKHLILADPWGFPERPGDTLSNKVSLPIWVKAIAFVVSPLNPLWAVRASGPLGESLIVLGQTLDRLLDISYYLLGDHFRCFKAKEKQTLKIS
jgi:hypothetical protein